MTDMSRHCPHCGESVGQTPATCPNCGEALAVGPFGSQNPDIPYYIGLIAAVVGLVFPIAGVVSAMTGLSLAVMHSDNERAAHLIVAGLLFGGVALIL